MAAAWRNLLKILGFGKKEEKKPERHHPYDEVSDEQLNESRRQQAPRYHPYDEVTDEKLVQNRLQQKGPRNHPYDEVTDEQLEQNRASLGSTSRQPSAGPKMDIASDEGSNGAPSGTPGLNYAQVDVQPMGGGGPAGGATRPSSAAKQPNTIYSDVRPGSAS